MFLREEAWFEFESGVLGKLTGAVISSCNIFVFILKERHVRQLRVSGRSYIAEVVACNVIKVKLKGDIQAASRYCAEEATETIIYIHRHIDT